VNRNQINVNPCVIRQRHQIPGIGSQDLVTVHSKAHQGSINYIPSAAQAQQNAGAFAEVGVKRPDFQPGEQAGDHNLATGPSPPDLSDHSPMGDGRPARQAFSLDQRSDLTVSAFYGKKGAGVENQTH
jgi:hypothetical protein